MPPKKPLPPEAVAALTEWVKTGAAVPERSATEAGEPTRESTGRSSRSSLRPCRQLPGRSRRSSNEIDAFVLGEARARRGWHGSPRADRRTLIRRAYFDLIGLPPTADEVDAFEKDTRPKAWEKLIDRLLASPHYGERWGRYWLDVARYADTKGYVFQEDRNFPYAYTYRDYVIRSFNEDKPYDQFVIEQLAADQLATRRRQAPARGAGLPHARPALPRTTTHDIIDDRIDVVTRGLMGLTVTCARCHDHKYDPIPTADYYSLYGVFASTHRAEGPAADRRSEADARSDRVREGSREARGGLQAPRSRSGTPRT